MSTGTNCRECIEYFLKHDPDLINRPVLAGTVCRPGTSPVMMASLKQNESMLKFLFARGAQPLNIPTYNPRETSNIIRFDAIYQTMVALSNPIYLCIMNEDPIMVSFKISERCQQISEDLDVVAKDVLFVKNRRGFFASSEFIFLVSPTYLKTDYATKRFAEKLLSINLISWRNSFSVLHLHFNVKKEQAII